MAERMKARLRSHPVDHMPLVTAPSVVLDVIREAIEEARSLTFCDRHWHRRQPRIIARTCPTLLSRTIQ